MKRQQKRKHLENEGSQETDEKGGGIPTSQEDVPQPGSMGVARVCSLGLDDSSSASEYFSCVSSPWKLVHVGTRRLHRDSPQPRSPLAQVQERGATPPTSQRVSFSSSSSYKTCATSLSINKQKRGMKIYYMQVQMKKGVAVSWETEETSESLGKQPRMEEVTLSEDVRIGKPPSDVSTRNLLSDCEPSGEEKEHEEKAEADSPPASPAVEERPRAQTPDWLVTLESGFRCMACCRVFASVDHLRQHVQYGVREGFSCHVFHLTMAQLIGHAESESTHEEEQEQEDEDEEEKQEGEEEEEQPEGEGFGLETTWSQCPGCAFHSSEERNN